MEQLPRGNRFFKNLPVLGGVIKSFDVKIGKLGLQGMVADFLEHIGSRWEVCGGYEEAFRILKNSPAVVIFNHPHDAEVLPLMAALPRRDDIYIIGTSGLVGAVGPNFDRYLIPVHVRKHAVAGSRRWRVRIGRSLLRFNLTVADEEAHQQNKLAIEEGSRRVREGAVVFIVPEGARPGGRWFSGVGHLLRGIGRNAGAYFVPVYVEGTSAFDFLRLIPWIGRRLRPFRVVFFAPKKIKAILGETKDPKVVTEKLQEEYNRQVRDWRVGN